MALYKPGEEPEAIAKKLRSFLAKIDEYYPDRQVVGLHNEHKKLGERLTKLYRELGYESGEELLNAYGYVYAQKKRASASDEEKQARKDAMIAELKRRYPDGSSLGSIAELKEANPDLSNEITNSHLRKEELLEAGILSSDNNKTKRKHAERADKYEPLCAELRTMILAKYPNGPQWPDQEGLNAAIPEAAPLIKEIRAICNTILLLPFTGEMVDRGIFAKRIRKQRAPMQCDVTRGQLERMYLLEKSDRSLAVFTRQSLGMPYSDYRNSRKSREPGGTIGIALNQLKELLPKIDQSAEKLSNTDSRKLASIAQSLGYPDIQTLLEAYGYNVR